MKRTAIILLLIILIAVVTTSFISCGSRNEIIGKWKAVYSEHHPSFILSSIQFNKDKTISGITRKDGTPMAKWKWKYDKVRDDGKIKYSIINEYSTTWYAILDASKKELFIYWSDSYGNGGYIFKKSYY